MSVTHFTGCGILTTLIIFHQGLHRFFSFKITSVANNISNSNRSSFSLLVYIHCFDFSQHVSFLLSTFLSLRSHASKEIEGLTGRALETFYLPCRLSEVSAHSLNCFLPHFWAFPWQLGASERVSEKTEVSSGSSILSQTSCLLEKKQRKEEKQHTKKSLGKLLPAL